MKILVNGPSVSLGPESWPIYLKKQLNCEVVNFSRINCGNRYIHDATMLELSQRCYDLVIISWTYFSRMDARSRWPDAVLHTAELEDPTVYNNPNLDKFWMFERSGHPGWSRDDVDRYAGTLDQFRRLQNSYNGCYSDHYRLEETLLHIISLQSFLKNSNTPYVFTFYKPLLRLKKFQHLYNQIDSNNVHSVHLCHLAKQNHWLKNHHPTGPAHDAYVKTLLAHPSIKSLVDENIN